MHWSYNWASHQSLPHYESKLRMANGKITKYTYLVKSAPLKERLTKRRNIKGEKLKFAMHFLSREKLCNSQLKRLLPQDE